ncbi:hypothetical protein J6590_101150 [Homalodisca vitripennis]|nr:hypothetical protein J6590_101150 [Homalodisca vitripennis]
MVPYGNQGSTPAHFRYAAVVSLVVIEVSEQLVTSSDCSTATRPLRLLLVDPQSQPTSRSLVINYQITNTRVTVVLNREKSNNRQQIARFNPQTPFIHLLDVHGHLGNLLFHTPPPICFTSRL